MKKYVVLILAMVPLTAWAGFDENFEHSRKNLNDLFQMMREQNISQGLTELEALASSDLFQAAGDEAMDLKKLKEADAQVQLILRSHGIGAALTERHIVTARILNAVIDVPQITKVNSESARTFSAKTKKEWLKHYEDLAREVAKEIDRPTGRGATLMKELRKLDQNFNDWYKTKFFGPYIEALILGGLLISGLFVPIPFIYRFNPLVSLPLVIASGITGLGFGIWLVDVRPVLLEAIPHRFDETLAKGEIVPPDYMKDDEKSLWLEMRLTGQITPDLLNNSVVESNVKKELSDGIDRILDEMESSYRVDRGDFAPVENIKQQLDTKKGKQLFDLKIALDGEMRRMQLAAKLSPFDPFEATALHAHKIFPDFNCKVNLAAIGAAP
jgi:hypothetical protein